MPQVMEVEVAEARRTGRLPEHTTHVHAIVGLVVTIREDSFTGMALKLTLEEFPGRLAQQLGPGTSLRSLQPHHSLIEVDVLAPTTRNFAEAHQRRKRELRDLRTAIALDLHRKTRAMGPTSLAEPRLSRILLETCRLVRRRPLSPDAIGVLTMP